MIHKSNVSLSNTLIFFLASITWMSLSVEVQSQTTEKMNFKWMHHHGDMPGAELPDYKDDGWDIVKLPHDASLAVSGKDSTGWYRKHIELFGTLNRRKIYMEFEGVLYRYDFWVNGHPLGSDIPGLERRIFDVTPYLHTGQNVIALKYYGGSEYGTDVVGSGLIRNAWVHFNNQLHIQHNGLSIACSEVNRNKASLSIACDVINNRSVPAECKLQVSISNPEEHILFEEAAVHTIPPGGTYVFKLTRQVVHPKLWNTESPNLYKAVFKIADSRGVVDVHHADFAIREIHYLDTGTIHLNHIPIALNCVRFVPMYGPLGAAEHERGVERILQAIKALGFNAILADTVFHSPYIIRECDRIGILLFDEEVCRSIDLKDILDESGFPMSPANQFGSRPSLLTMEADRKYIAADGYDLCFIRLRMFDKSNRIVKDYDPDFKFKVKGAAEIVGSGKNLLILRSNQKKGIIEIRAKGKGMAACKLIIEAV